MFGIGIEYPHRKALEKYTGFASYCDPEPIRNELPGYKAGMVKDTSVS